MKIINISLMILLLASSSALKADDDKNYDLGGSVGFISDYRDRGFSLSDKDISAFGSLSIYYNNGLYGGIIVSSVDDPDDRNFKGDFFVGWGKESGSYIYDFSVEVGSLVGGPRERIFPEFQASIARDYGLLFAKMGVAWAPNGRWSSPDNDTFYGYFDGEIPVPTMPSITLLTHLGYDVRSGRKNLWDWSTGVSVFVKNTEFTISYEDSSSRNAIASGAVIFGLRQHF